MTHGRYVSVEILIEGSGRSGFNGTRTGRRSLKNFYVEDPQLEDPIGLSKKNIIEERRRVKVD